MDGKVKSSRRAFILTSSTAVAALALRPVLASGRSASPLPLVEKAAYTMGSIVTVKAYCEDEALCARGIDEAIRELKRIDTLMSVFDERSQVSFVNRRSGYAETGVDFRIIDILGHARHYYNLTQGAFDCTVEPLMELYGFRDDASVHHFPTDRRIAETLDGVGMENVTVDSARSSVAFACPSTRLDFGGIAVGYALDRAVRILKSRGIESAIINHSGDIFAIGTPPGEDGWEVGIVDPANDTQIATTTRIRDQALSTSGNYENFIEADGKTIGHLLDPRSGRTAREMRSATVIAHSATEADALSTGFFVMGKDKSNAILSGRPDLRLISL